MQSSKQHNNNLRGKANEKNHHHHRIGRIECASIANFTNATEQQNPYAQSNAQVQSQAVALEQVNYGKVNGKVVNPLFKYTGETTASQVSSDAYSVRVSH